MGAYLPTVALSPLLFLDSDVEITPPGYLDEPYRYVFQIDALAPGDKRPGLPLVTEDDADFIARSWGIFAEVDFNFRCSDSEGRWMQSQLARYQTICAGTALVPVTLPAPLYIPRGGVLLFDVTANPLCDQTGLIQIIFNGVKRKKVS